MDGLADQELLDVQGVVDTSCQFPFLAKVVDPNLTLSDSSCGLRMGKAYQESFPISLTYYISLNTTSIGQIEWTYMSNTRNTA
jgi:hypothetical protein